MSNMDIFQIRNFRDFLLLYNQISETCFNKCASALLSRDITDDEELCIKNCAQKYINANHKIMEVYVEIQPILVRKRIEEINNAQTALELQSQENQQTEKVVQT